MLFRSCILTVIRSGIDGIINCIGPHAKLKWLNIKNLNVAWEWNDRKRQDTWLRSKRKSAQKEKIRFSSKTVITEKNITEIYRERCIEYTQCLGRAGRKKNTFCCLLYQVIFFVFTLEGVFYDICFLLFLTITFRSPRSWTCFEYDSEARSYGRRGGTYV